jgi:hypothetical protein
MRFLVYLLLLIVGGVIGFFIGGATTVATGLTGTALGVCSAAKVAGQMGLLTADQQASLLGQTSTYLRSEFPKLTKQLGLEGQPPLSPERCADVATQIDAIRQRTQ